MRSIDEIREKMDEIAIEKEVFNEFEKVCEHIDENPEEMVEEFKTLSDEISSVVDGFIEKLDTFASDIKHARQQKLFWERNIVKLENDLEGYRLRMSKKLKLGARYVGNSGSIRLIKSRPEVKIINERSIPDEFKNFVTKFTINKTALREFLVTGNKIDGVILRQENHIMTKRS